MPTAVHVNQLPNVKASGPPIAVALAATNIVSGFLITERILKMFKARKGTS
jgi:NAD/NADP transhydrogenase alpha subunit